MTRPTSATRRGPGRPRAGSNDNTRELAIESATELFAVSGFRGTSLAEVAQRAGLSQSGLLHYFPTKLHLLADVLAHRDQVDADYLDALIDDAAIGFQAFDLILESIKRNLERPHFIQLYVTMSGEATNPAHPAHLWLQEHFISLNQRLSSALQRGQAAGLVDPAAPVAAITRSFIALLDGLQLQWIVDSEGSNMLADVTQWIKTLRERWQQSSPP